MVHVCKGNFPVFGHLHHCNHRHYSGGSRSTINIFNSCSGNHTSFGGGFVAGLGFSLGGLFSGLFGGGIPMFGGMGMGMPMFGGMNMWSPWQSFGMDQIHCNCSRNNGSTNGTNDGSNNNNKPGDAVVKDDIESDPEAKADSNKKEIKNSGNADTPKYNKLREEYDNLKNMVLANNKTSDYDNRLTDLKKELEELCTNPIDQANEIDDKENYERLLREVNLLKLGKILPNVELEKVLSNKTKWANIPLNLDELNKMSEPDFENALNKLKPEDAQIILIKLGYINFDASSPQYKDFKKQGSCQYLCGKITDNTRVLKLLDIADIAVEVHKGDNPNNKDNWVTGTISEVTTGEKGDLKSFDVDCNTDGHNGFCGSYTFTMASKTETETTFTVAANEENTTTYVVDNKNTTVLKNGKEHMEGDLQINRK